LFSPARSFPGIIAVDGGGGKRAGPGGGDGHLPDEALETADSITGIIMKRAFQLLGILGLATLLAGCDKCGNLGPFFTGPEQKTCTSSTPQG
jgi:hypothetical protein